MRPLELSDLKRFVAGADVFSRQSDGTTIAAQYAKQGITLRLPHLTSSALAAVIAVLREQVLPLGGDRYMADDLAKATALVAAGTLPAAVMSVLKKKPFPNLAERGHP